MRGSRFNQPVVLRGGSAGALLARMTHPMESVAVRGRQQEILGPAAAAEQPKLAEKYCMRQEAGMQ